MLEFHHSDFLHAQVEKSIQCILGLEPIDLLQPSQQAPASVGQESTDGSQAEKEQPVSFLHPLLTHVSRFLSLFYFDDYLFLFFPYSW